MFDFNDRSRGIFAAGFTDRDGVGVGDTFVYRLRAKLLGQAARNFSREQNAALAQRFSSAEMAAIMNDDPMAPHMRVQYDPNYYGGQPAKAGRDALVPAALVELLGGDVPAAFEMMHGVDRVHITHFSADEAFDADGEPLADVADAPAA